jgi:hypothetical protein
LAGAKNAAAELRKFSVNMDANGLKALRDLIDAE